MPRYVQGVPPFLVKLREMLTDPAVEGVTFNEERMMFNGTMMPPGTVVLFCPELEKTLPAFFKHGNLSSFVRQMQFYGFIKDGSAYRHPNMVLDDPDRMRLITRKRSRVENDRIPRSEVKAIVGRAVIATEAYMLEMMRVQQNVFLAEIRRLEEASAPSPRIMALPETYDLTSTPPPLAFQTPIPTKVAPAQK